MAHVIGRVEALWRYPVKSFRGEPIGESAVDARGLAGDRGWALRDRANGRVMSAKRWTTLVACGARYPDGPEGEPEVTLPDGTTARGAAATARLSAWLDHEVELVRAAPERQEQYEIAIQTVDEIEAGVDPLAIDAGDFPCPPGSFFDAAPLHLLSDATLAALAARHPAGRWDVRRFRPNVVIATDGATGTVEEEWVGRMIEVGEVRIAVLMPTIRCVMTTLPQEELPRDTKILRTVAQEFSGNAGIYAHVERGGRIRVGDPIRLAE